MTIADHHRVSIASSHYPSSSASRFQLSISVTRSNIVRDGKTNATDLVNCWMFLHRHQIAHVNSTDMIPVEDPSPLGRQTMS